MFDPSNHDIKHHDNKPHAVNNVIKNGDQTKNSQTWHLCTRISAEN